MAHFLAEEIVAVFRRLRTSKTFYVALVALAHALYGWFDGQLTGHQAIGYALVALAIIGIRDAFEKIFSERFASIDTSFTGLLRILATAPPENLPPQVLESLERHGVHVATVQSVFRHALELADDPAATPPPLPLPVVSPSPPSA